MGKTRVEIRGIIVSAWYDDEWFTDLVTKGCITPESSVRKRLSGASGDVDIYINSTGGSVFPGCEMINAINEAAARGCKINITVGAMAASMAANIALLAKAQSVKCHANTKFMFHGAMSITDGGKGAHEDGAELLGKINGDIIAALKAKGATDCEAWFEEGRMKWLTAGEAKQMGIVDEIIGQSDSAPAKADGGAKDALAGLGIDIAAFDFGQGMGEGSEGEGTTPPCGHPSAGGELAAAMAQVGELQARMAGMQSAKDKEIAEVRAKLTESLDSATATIKDLESQLAKSKTDFDGAIASLNAEKEAHEKTRKDLGDTAKQLEVSKAQHAALVGGALSQKDGNPVTCFEEAVKACGGKVADARMKYPEFYAEYMIKNSKKKVK